MTDLDKPCDAVRMTHDQPIVQLGLHVLSRLHLKIRTYTDQLAYVINSIRWHHMIINESLLNWLLPLRVMVNDICSFGSVTIF